MIKLSAARHGVVYYKADHMSQSELIDQLNNAICSLGCAKPDDIHWVRQPFGWRANKRDIVLRTAVELNNRFYCENHSLSLSTLLSGVVFFSRTKSTRYYLDGLRLI